MWVTPAPVHTYKVTVNVDDVRQTVTVNVDDVRQTVTVNVNDVRETHRYTAAW